MKLIENYTRLVIIFIYNDTGGRKLVVKRLGVFTGDGDVLEVTSRLGNIRSWLGRDLKTKRLSLMLR